VQHPTLRHDREIAIGREAIVTSASAIVTSASAIVTSASASGIYGTSCCGKGSGTLSY
jgi:hypothetical protein